MKFKNKIWRVGGAGTVFLLGLFLFPQNALADLTIPSTPCDTEQVDAIIPGFGTSAHITSDMTREDGETAFTHGTDNNSFVTTSGDVITLHPNLLFTPTTSPRSFMKLLAYNASCTLVFGFGPISGTDGDVPLQAGANTVSYNLATDEVTFNDGIAQRVRPNLLPRYIWLEAWDGKTTPDKQATYSYLVDLQNPQNPTGTVDDPPEPEEPDPVIIIPGILGSFQKDGFWVIDPVLHKYDDLLATMEANGYIPDEDLFTFPYDWRQSNTITALILKLKINEVKQICQCDKVDLVAHSMGGLVARQYIQSDRYEDDVDQLIFLGTPHLGAPKSYLSWEGGELRPTKTSHLEKFILSREARKEGFDSVYDYVRNKPILSVNELLPIYDYIKDKDSGLIREYPNNYPVNPFLENLNQDLDSLLNSGVEISNVVGILPENSTIERIRVVPSAQLPLWEHGYPEGFDGSTEDRGLELGLGDETVTQVSASQISEDLNVFASKHGSLPSDAQAFVYEKLTGEAVSVLINDLYIPDAKFLFIKILSPVDVVIIAPDGKRIGKDFDTGQEINEIENAFYSGFATDNEFVTILNPLDGEYTVLTQGTDDGGEYIVASAYISEEESVEFDYTGQTTPGLITELNLTVDNENPEVLEVVPEDTTPPEITINSPLAQDYLRSEVLSIDVTVQDTETGVFDTEILFDDIIITEDTIDLFFENLGNHGITVNSQDFIGNQEEEQVDFRVISTVESTIADVQRAYELGWITDKKLKDKIIKKLNKVLKEEDKIDKLREKSNKKPKKTEKQIQKKEKKIDKILGKQIIKTS